MKNGQISWSNDNKISRFSNLDSTNFTTVTTVFHDECDHDKAQRGKTARSQSEVRIRLISF